MIGGALMVATSTVRLVCGYGAQLHEYHEVLQDSIALAEKLLGTIT